MDQLSIKDLLQQGETSSTIIHGWVRYARKQSKLCFVHIYDGSSSEDLHCVFLREHFSPEIWNQIKKLNGGCSVRLEGKMVKSQGEGQDIELLVSGFICYGKCDLKTYPIVPKKDYTMQYLRQYPHLRFRSKTIQAITRIADTLAFATRSFYRTHGFIWLRTPLITASDCEGAGECFEISSDARHQMALAGEASREIMRIEAGEKLSDDDKQKRQVMIDAKKHFFGKQAFLTVSGQLDAESAACGLSKVYTFGPTFRAENSDTYRHLAEFWMVEPEMAFTELDGDMKLAQAYVQFCLQMVLDDHSDDLEYLEKNQTDDHSKGLIKRLKTICSASFPRVTYSEAIKLLQQEVKDGIEFEISEIVWGMDLKSEHEKHLVQKCFDGQPIIVHAYPSEIKAFYMHENEIDADQHKTVAAMDMLVPGIGELIGGSQREIRIDILLSKMEAAGLDPEDYKEYLDLRKYGNVPHSGFGLGFERLIMLATGTHHIRDVIPFPRAVGLI